MVSWDEYTTVPKYGRKFYSVVVKSDPGKITCCDILIIVHKHFPGVKIIVTLQQNQAAARRCVDLFNQKRIAERVEACYAANTKWIELPRPQSPKGQHGDREFLRIAAKRTLALVPDHQMKILNLVAQDDQVALEIDWRGTTAAALGNLPAGSEVRYWVATFLTFTDRMIVKQVDYCIPIQGEVARQ